jgi:hypothetical protein
MGVHLRVRREDRQDTGLDEGDRGYRQALKAGQPDGTPIFYCIDEDYDVNDPTFTGPIDDYMRGVNEAFAKAAAPSPPKYTVGVYGSGAVCDWLIRKGRATKGWMAVSPGWRGHDTYTGWSIKQGDKDTSLGFDNDTDVTQGDFGAWQLPPQGMLLALWTKLTA